MRLSEVRRTGSKLGSVKKKCSKLRSVHHVRNAARGTRLGSVLLHNCEIPSGNFGSIELGSVDE